MTTALMSSTQITYQFTVTVNVNVNADKTFLLMFACFAFVIWIVQRLFWEVKLLTHDVTSAVAFITIVIVIGLKALAYGFIGVRL
jgi:hypothetical protein